MVVAEQGRDPECVRKEYLDKFTLFFFFAAVQGQTFLYLPSSCSPAPLPGVRESKMIVASNGSLFIYSLKGDRHAKTRHMQLQCQRRVRCLPVTIVAADEVVEGKQIPTNSRFKAFWKDDKHVQ